MKCVLVIEAKASVLQLRRSILNDKGYKTTGMLTSGESIPEGAFRGISAISLGHSLPLNARCELLAALKSVYPNVPSVALLRRDEQPITIATFNCSADDPVDWLTTVMCACGSGVLNP
jgi:DNA-binding NarL/FixJ family response regulator